MSLRLRAATRDDAAAAGEICYGAFKTIADQHRFPPDFPSPDVAIGLMEMILSRDDIHAVMAEGEGRVVGSNFLWEGGAVAGVGPITVESAAQNGAIGRRLMDAVLERARGQGISSVRLVQAGYHMRSLSLYAKLGFEVREPLVMFQGDALGISVDGHTVRSAREADLDVANDVCRRIHGHDRAGELAHAIRQGTARVAINGGRITGYTTGIGFFGHAVGETTAAVQALIAEAESFSGPGFLLPSRNSALFRWCLERGLRAVQPMTLMTLGPYTEPRGAFLPSILY